MWTNEKQKCELMAKVVLSIHNNYKKLLAMNLTRNENNHCLPQTEDKACPHASFLDNRPVLGVNNTLMLLR